MRPLGSLFEAIQEAGQPIKTNTREKTIASVSSRQRIRPKANSNRASFCYAPPEDPNKGKRYDWRKRSSQLDFEKIGYQMGAAGAINLTTSVRDHSIERQRNPKVKNILKA